MEENSSIIVNIPSLDSDSDSKLENFLNTIDCNSIFRIGDLIHGVNEKN